MKATLSAKKLNEKLKFIKEIYKMKKLDDMYRNMLLKFQNGYLYIVAINPMCCVRTYIDMIQQDCTFGVLVDAVSFISIIGRYSVDLDFEFQQNGNLVISHDSGNVVTKWFNTSSFPAIYEQSGEVLSYKCSYLIPFLKKSFMFTTYDEFTISTSMIYISIDERYINVMSTDRFSIYAHREENVDKVKDSNISINEVTASILYGMASNSKGDIKISSDKDGRITFLSFDDTVIYNVNPEHKIPGFNRVIEGYSPSTKLIVRKKIIMDSIARSIVDDIVSTVYIGNSRSGIETNDISKGISFKEYFGRESMEGESVSFDIKLKKIKDAISCIEGDRVMIEVSMPNKFLRVSDPENQHKEFVLLSTYKN